MENDQPFVDKKQYELAVLLDSETAEAIIDEFLIKNQIEVHQKEKPKTVKLAYPINKHTTATLVVYRFTAPPALIPDFKESLKTQPNSIRFLLIKSPIIKTQKVVPSPEIKAAPIDIKPPKTEALSNEMLEETLEKILQ